MEPVVVTAYASLSALGRDRAAVLGMLARGESGLTPGPAALPFATMCGAVATPLPELHPELARYDTRIARMTAALVGDLDTAIASARARWGDARVGVLVGTSTAGIASTEAAWRAYRGDGAVPASYDFARQHAYDGILVVIRALTGVTGPGWVVSTACSSSAKVVASAMRLIALGVVDAVICGGVDTLCDITLRGFHALGALAPGRCRPFGAGRDGINIGEGGALFVVARDGDARARVLAVGESSDAHHVSAPHPEGAGARAAMEAALVQAGVAADTIGHVNAHGTATPLNDRAEAMAIASVLGAEVPVLSTKGYTGHMLGAAGAMELVLTMMALESGWIPRSLGADPIDPELGIHVVQERTRLATPLALSSSFAFGGNNTCVLVSAP